MIRLLIFLYNRRCWLKQYTQPLQHFTSHLSTPRPHLPPFTFDPDLPVLPHSCNFAHPRILEPGPVLQLADRRGLQLRVEVRHFYPRIYLASRKVREDDAVPANVVVIVLSVGYSCTRNLGYMVNRSTVTVTRMSHRKSRETKQQPSSARSGNQISCCLVSLHFLCDILATVTVQGGPSGHGQPASPARRRLSRFAGRCSSFLRVYLIF